MERVARQKFPRTVPARATIAAAAVPLATAVASVTVPGSSPARAAAATAVVTAPAQTIAGFGASGAWWVNDLAKFSPGTQSETACRRR